MSVHTDRPSEFEYAVLQALRHISDPEGVNVSQLDHLMHPFGPARDEQIRNALRRLRDKGHVCGGGAAWFMMSDQKANASAD